MEVLRAAEILTAYKEKLPGIDLATHAEDHMLKTAVNGMRDYLFVGESTIHAILRAAQIGALTKFDDILDFGCGHGREARHLKIAFPKQRLHFSDIDQSCWEFCRDQFQGEGFPSVEDFSTLSIPKQYDLIWLGSVFTHLDWDRSRTLLRKLTEALKPEGAVVATFRGRACLDMMMREPEKFNFRGYYDRMFDDFRSTGFGYMDYSGHRNWGQNLISFGKMEELTPDLPDIHCVATIYRGWANIHDVGIWKRSA